MHSCIRRAQRSRSAERLVHDALQKRCRKLNRHVILHCVDDWPVHLEGARRTQKRRRGRAVLPLPLCGWPWHCGRFSSRHIHPIRYLLPPHGALSWCPARLWAFAARALSSPTCHRMLSKEGVVVMRSNEFKKPPSRTRAYVKHHDDTLAVHMLPRGSELHVLTSKAKLVPGR